MMEITFLFCSKAYYLASARELIRINGTTKAPVMNYAAETSLGVVTIRAFKMGHRFFHNYLKLVDTDAILFFHSNATMEWLIIRTEALQNLTFFVVTVAHRVPTVIDSDMVMVLSYGKLLYVPVISLSQNFNQNCRACDLVIFLYEPYC